MGALFCYGTLMYRPLLQALTATEPAMTEASLSGYACFAVQGAAFPAIVPQGESLVKGQLVTNIPPAAWPRLDRYEGEYYRRQPVLVVTAEGLETEASAYVMRPRYRLRLSRRRWQYGPEAERYAKAQLLALGPAAIGRS